MKSKLLRLLSRGGLLLLLFGSVLMVASGQDASNNNATQTPEEEFGEESEPRAAILFPWFAITIGVFSFYLLSRYADWFPFTAACFLLGTFMGIAVARRGDGVDNLLNQTLKDWWLQIDSEVLLIVFLPGLVYKDSSSLNPHLLRIGFWQCILFAFPIVLASTALTAVVTYYIFPYNWSFPFCMTIGSILSATDPVAVNALLDAVGAPPRLKLHIAGESLLNDGSAIVFYTIFSSIYFTELMVPGLGEQVDNKEGVSLFFRMSLGGMCIGLMFGIGLMFLLNMLDKRLNSEENVVQVAATISLAYLCYFTADAAWETSGVIAVLSMGVFVRMYGQSVINDSKLFDDFLSLMEWLLNSVLFTLGGLQWGNIISNSDPNPDIRFTSKDWGYLFLLFVLLTVIRFFLFGSFYPIYSRMGLKSCWQEMVFQAYGGLRGAVGISLAIAVNSIVRKATSEENLDPKFEVQTSKLFCFVGGIAFLTLIINATSAGPILRKLGLADTSAVRKHMLDCFRFEFRQNLLDNMVQLLSLKRFSQVNFAVIRDHVPILADLTRQEVLDSAERYRKTKGLQTDYQPPKLTNILPYLKGGSEEEGVIDEDAAETAATSNEVELAAETTSQTSPKSASSNVNASDEVEIRRVFIELVRNEYQRMIQNGELIDNKLVAVTLFDSLDFAADQVQKGEPLSDYEIIEKQNTLSGNPVTDCMFSWPSIVRFSHLILGRSKKDFVDSKEKNMRIEIERCIVFISAHQKAANLVRNQFMSNDELSDAEKKVYAESKAQMELAEKVLASYPVEDVVVGISHNFCSILLNKGARHIDKSVEAGLIKPQEAGDFLDPLQDDILKLHLCKLQKHDGELPMKHDMHSSGSVDKNEKSG